MSKLLRINNKLMTNNNKLTTVAAYVPPAVSRVVYDTSSAQSDTYTTNLNRVIFALLPTTADETQFGITTAGLKTPNNGASIFWVTNYNISNSGDLEVTGYKGAYNNTACSSNSGWPSAPSNSLYYGNMNIYGVYTETHRMGLNVPTDAIAVLVAYNWGSDATGTLPIVAVNTNKVYSSVKDSCCAYIPGSTYVSAIYNMEANSTATISYQSSNIIYPYQSNKTIVIGSRTSLSY